MLLPALVSAYYGYVPSSIYTVRFGQTNRTLYNESAPVKAVGPKLDSQMNNLRHVSLLFDIINENPFNSTGNFCEHEINHFPI
jgi:sorbitol-specific phosphotransferase system component IIA